jgi:hypothetical protein
MPSEIVRPNSNINSGWGGGGGFGLVDDVVTNPTAGSQVDYAYQSGDLSSGAAQQWGCQAPSGSGTISSARLWIYGRADGNTDGYISQVRIRLNGTWYTGTPSTSFGSGLWSWIDCIFTGSYGEISGSAPAVELTYYGANGDAELYVDVVYLDITYVAAASPSINPAAMLALLGV